MVSAFDRLSAALTRLRETLTADDNVVFAFVFGSAARHPDRRPRDLDVAVLYRAPPEGLRLLDEIQRLSGLTGLEVDLVVLNDAPALLRHQVLRHGQRLVCRDAPAYRDFRAREMEDYDTYRHLSGSVAR
jgi:predicted nucleotidyltransferase